MVGGLEFLQKQFYVSYLEALKRNMYFACCHISFITTQNRICKKFSFKPIHWHKQNSLPKKIKNRYFFEKGFHVMYSVCCHMQYLVFSISKVW